MTIRHTSHSRFDLWYHFAWSTKYRKRIWIDDAHKARAIAMFRLIAEHHDIVISEINLVADHLHLIASAPPRMAPARIAQVLKSTSTKLLLEEFGWLKKHYWGEEIWVPGYFVRSVGPGLTKEQIERYVREQAEEI